MSPTTAMEDEGGLPNLSRGGAFRHRDTVFSGLCSSLSLGEGWGEASFLHLEGAAVEVVFRECAPYLQLLADDARGLGSYDL